MVLSGIGDQTDRIQAGIDFISSRPLINGFRGPGTLGQSATVTDTSSNSKRFLRLKVTHP